MKCFFPAAFVSFLLAGCVGAGPVTTRVATTEIKTPDRFPGKRCPLKESGHLGYCKGEVPPTTPAQFRSIWGEPKSHGMKDGQEYLTYSADLAWRGLVVFAIIPIPLLVPVGYNEVTLYFDHDNLVRISEEYGYGSYAICGLHSEGPDPIGCLIWH
jgi:hypothetical protein